MKTVRMIIALVLAVCLWGGAWGITKTELPKKSGQKASAAKKTAKKASRKRHIGSAAPKKAAAPAPAKPAAPGSIKPLGRKYASSVGAAKKGEVIKFGNYEQDGDPDNGREPIEWIVLDVDEEGDLLIITRYGLDAVEYNETKEAVDWEDSTIRDWLNEDFCYYAFDNDELSHIYRVHSSDSVEDSAFLLTPAMAEGLLSSDASRCAAATSYAKEQGVSASDSACRSWLENSGGASAPFIDTNGRINISGAAVDNAAIAVRPVMYIDPRAKMKNDNSFEDKVPSDLLLSGESSGRPEWLAHRIGALENGGENADFDTVSFGRYGGEPIKWLALEKTDSYMLLISADILDARRYHNSTEAITWEHCDLRRWLNNDFYYSAFSSDEKQRILVSQVKNEDNVNFDADGGNDTEDKVYLLSLDEARDLFDNDSQRLCRPTRYAESRGVYVFRNNGCCWWWLRSPGKGNAAANITYFGSRNITGSTVNESGLLCPGGGVRPVIRVRLTD